VLLSSAAIRRSPRTRIRSGQPLPSPDTAVRQPCAVRAGLKCAVRQPNRDAVSRTTPSNSVSVMVVVDTSTILAASQGPSAFRRVAPAAQGLDAMLGRATVRPWLDVVAGQVRCRLARATVERAAAALAPRDCSNLLLGLAPPGGPQTTSGGAETLDSMTQTATLATEIAAHDAWSQHHDPSTFPKR
jgi:hypothetical protein